MSRVLTNEQNYYDIADTIRQMKNVETTYKPREMASALKDIYSNEVEGVPPLSFEANGNNLLNYRIDGATGGVGERTKNLWNDNITFENGTINQNTGADSSYASNYRIRSNFTDYIEPGQYTLNVAGVERINTIALYSEKNIESFVESISSTSTIPKTFSLQTGGYIRVALSKVNGDIVTPSEISNIQLEEGSATDYEQYGYKVPIVVSGKNLFDELQVVDKTVSSESSNFQIFKQNEKLIINGLTTISQADVEIANINSINNQALQFINSNEAQYIFSAEVPGRIMIRYKLLGSDVVRYTFDEYNSSNRVADRIVFRLQQNYQYNNEQMNIMFKLKQIQSDNYEAYHEQTITNIYLDNPILENESISLSDTNTNISTIEGTNVLTINTTVQPSNVYIQAPKDSEEIVYLTKILEEEI